MKKIGRILLIILIVSVVLFFISSPIINDISAINIQNVLTEIPLPKDTKFIEYIWNADKSVGNGNGMQFLGAILIKSDLIIEEMVLKMLMWR